MSTNDDLRQVNKRLAVYSPDTQLNSYINGASDVNSLCYAMLLGKLDSESAISTERLHNLQRDLRLKLMDAKLYIESERIKTKVEDDAAQENVARIKRQMVDNLPVIRKLNEEMKRRNHMLKAMNAHISMANEILEEMFSGNSELSASKQKWEEVFGKASLEKLMASNVFKTQVTSVRDSSGEKHEIEELVVYTNFSKDTSGLKRTNELMEGDIQRLTEELAEYKTKWSHNAEVFDKISEVLKDEMVKRNIVKPEEEEQEEEVDEYDEEEEDGDNEEREEEDVDPLYPVQQNSELDNDEFEEDADNEVEVNDDKILKDFDSVAGDDHESEDIDMEDKKVEEIELADKEQLKDTTNEVDEPEAAKSNSSSPEAPDIE